MSRDWNEEEDYLSFMHDLIDLETGLGEVVEDRTGVGTISTFGASFQWDLENGFPAWTTKRLAWKSIVGELLWFLEGSTDERRLAEITYEKDRTELFEKETIWTANADAQGKELGYVNTPMRKDLGPVYGHQWRNLENDQIGNLVKSLRDNPRSRRHIISSWNVDSIDRMALPPCHTLMQFNVSNAGGLSCILYQRSADMFLGVPFNVASYALLTYMLADHLGYTPMYFIHNIGDAHVYLNHVDGVKEMVSRKTYPLPKLNMPRIESFDIDFIETLKPSMFKLEGYNYHPTIKAPMAV